MLIFDDLIILRYPTGMGAVHMNEVQCSGFEKSVTECVFNMDKDSEGCNHEEDAGVRCNVPAMGFQQRVSTLNTPTHTGLIKTERPTCICVAFLKIYQPTLVIVLAAFS